MYECPMLDKVIKHLQYSNKFHALIDPKLTAQSTKLL